MTRGYAAVMRRRSGLDRLIYRFQDRWETNSQFRAMLSGVLGLVMIVALCSCMGVVTTIANNTVANVNASRNVGSRGSQNADTGVGQIKGVPTFPTSTVPAWPQMGAPTYGAIPDSQTPLPSPSAQPTATAQPTVPCTSNCGGGGGGGGAWTVVVTGYATPATWTANGAGSYTIHTSAPGVGLAIVITFPGGGTFLDENGEVTDSSGNYTSHFTVPGGTPAGNADVWVQAYYNGVVNDKFHFPVPCQ
jgi:hypothetical protein